MKSFTAPLTGHERIVPPGEILVSRTDLHGTITYANNVFAGVSGYTQEELLGHSHNIVRHPDMPPAVFADLWQALRAGRMWHGLLKNRCRNGDHYWVDALMVPIVEDGIAIGYLSARRQAARDAIAAAERHYQALRAGTTHTVRPWKFRLDRYLSIRSGVLIGIAFVTAMILLGAAIGLGTIAKAERELGAMHREKVEAGNALGRIKFLMADNRAHVMLATLHDPKNPLSASHDHPLGQHLEVIEKNQREIEGLWRTLRSRVPAGATAELADIYWAARTRYVGEGLAPVVQALAEGNFAAANARLVRQVNSLYGAANSRADELIRHMLDDSGQRYAGELALHETVQRVVFGGIVGVLAILAVSGLLFFRGVVGPVDARIRDLERMAEGKLDAHVDIEGRGELGKLNRAFAAAQAKLQYLLDNTFRGATQLCEESSRLKVLVLRLGDGIEDQHERVFRVLDRIKECAAGIAGLSGQAETLLTQVERCAAGKVADGGAGDVDAEHAAAFVASARALAASLRILSFTSDEMEREMAHVADFLVEDREAMHAMWSAAAHLAQTATSLETAAGYFEIR